ncbi:uncharacterized protein LOC109715519 [Ananas comosus]|uniref:Uncharacterized protein LOC109715519 n=1 Tax=Ananas comosus TaxID=4615 RepID=A0A199W2F9_ANACO|nr:uncharacterized protein LOC109715519 [Ananas comosus]OAY83431.1 hypothetical protein ACMD2_18863 [Ananas comosus]
MSGQGRSVSIHSSRFFSPGGEPAGPVGPGGDEFDESEIWGSPVEPGPAEPGLNPLHRARPGRRKPERAGAPVTAPCSLPVNIPDWSKILGGEYKGKEWSEAEAEEEEKEEERGEDTAGMVPPHVWVWRNRPASCSVREGLGRTLKGRDLNRVRNAIWAKIGFQD